MTDFQHFRDLTDRAQFRHAKLPYWWVKAEGINRVGNNGPARDSIKRTAWVSTFLAFSAGLLLHYLHLSQHEISEISPVMHWLRDSAMAWPVTFLVFVVLGEMVRSALARAGIRRTEALGRIVWATAIGIGYAAALVPGSLVHGMAFGAEHGDVNPLIHGAWDAAAALPFAVVTLALWAFFVGLPSERGFVTSEARVVASVTAAIPARIRKRLSGLFLGRSNEARSLRRAVILATSLSLLFAALPLVGDTLGTPGVHLPEAEAATPAVPECNNANADRVYDVAAINTIIPFNRWGDVNRHGQMYALQQDKEAYKYWAFPLEANPVDDPAGNRRLRPRPLVLRANEGECIKVNFTNELGVFAPVPPGSPPAFFPNTPPPAGVNEGLPFPQHASMHVHGASFNVETSDGLSVGFNTDTTVAPGLSITYFWRAPSVEGLYFISDGVSVAGSEADGGSISAGLYGGLAVEPAGSEWYDPTSGARLSTTPTPYTEVADVSGELYIAAIIVPPAAQGAAHDASIPDHHFPNTVAFRETIQISQDEIPGDHLQNCDLKFVAGKISSLSDCLDTDPVGDVGFDFGIGLGFNYGEEHLLIRQAPINRCPDCVGEEVWLSSWPYGDPALVKLGSGLGPWYPAWHPFYRDATGDFVNTEGVDEPSPGIDNLVQVPGAIGVPETCGLADTAVDRDFDGVVDDLAPTSCFTSNVVHNYQFDASKVRYMHAGPKETHVFHMHAHQWLTDPKDVGDSGSTPGQPGLNGPTSNLPQSSTIDSQTFGPGEAFTEDILFGAGSRPGTVGDSIFHCHLYPHFAEGFWSLYRVHDVVEDGTGITPDGIGVNAILPLPDRIAAGDVLPLPSGDNLGYPRWIPGQYGWRAPQPIDGVSNHNGGADDPATSLLREDLEPAIRLVAGQALDVAFLKQIQSVSNNATGGSFTLTFDSATTGAIGYTADAFAVEAALDVLALPGIDFDVSGVGKAWLVRIRDATTGALAINVDDDLIADDSGLTGTTTIAVDLASNPVWAQVDLEDRYTAGTVAGSINAGHMRIPGSPVVDPCPIGARTVTYNVSIIQLDVTYNEAGWHDTQGRILVLDEDVEAVLAGTKPAEPFFFRVNAGDCINFNLTNRLPNWLGNDDFLELIQTNMVGQHIHLVKFDVTASDGSSNGWNYQQAAWSADQKDFDDDVLTGIASCRRDEFGTVDLTADGCRIPASAGASFSPTFSCTAATCPRGQTISERWYADYELRTVFTHDHHFPAEDQNRGYFAALIVEPAGMDVRDPFSGEWFQPVDIAAHGPTCTGVTPAEAAAWPGTGVTNACEGRARGTSVDVIGPGPADDFREFSLGLQDFVSLYRPCSSDCLPSAIAGQEPIAPPDEPEGYPNDDPGVFGINYRNAPLVLRDTADPAYSFSSTVYGDPETPVFQGYAGDPVRVRLIQGSQEEQHVIQVHGMEFKDEPDDPGSPIVNAKSIGISEAFNLEVSQMTCGVGQNCFGDYLYSGASTDDVYLGVWGLIRVFGRQQAGGLLPLPDNIPPGPDGSPYLVTTGLPPPPASDPGTPCSADAPLRSFHVIGLDAPIVYNEFGDHDPYGLVYGLVLPGETPVEAAARIRASNPHPLVLHVNEDDCIEVTLTNMIDPAGAFAVEHGPVGAREVGESLLTPGFHGFDPPLVTEPSVGTPAGLRISLHAALLEYDVRGSDGATVGFNDDQTVGVGDSRLYRWWARPVSPGELGAINLTDYGDVRGHRHHGLFAGLIVHPSDATFHDPLTGVSMIEGALSALAEADAILVAEGVTSPDDLIGPAADAWQAFIDEANRLATAEQVDVRVPGQPDYRNPTVFFQDGLNLWDVAGDNMPDRLDHPPTIEEPEGELPDAEDRGEKGFNYRNEAFHNRLGVAPGEPLDGLDGGDLAEVFSSVVHGDPATPIFRAYTGDDVRVRVLQGADKQRQESFQLSGHAFPRQPFDDPADTELVGTEGGFSTGLGLNLPITAGGDVQLPGDYRYNDGALANHLSGGTWGILRIYTPDASPHDVFDPDAVLGADDPHLPNYHPVMPLEIVEVEVIAYDDSDADGVRDPGERLLGRSVNGASTIDGIPVQLYLAGPDGQVGTVDDVATGPVVTTDARGRAFFQVAKGKEFAVRGVAPADWAATGFGWAPVDALNQADMPRAELGFIQLGDVTVRVFEDANGNNVFDAAFDSWAVGWQVTLIGGGQTLVEVTADGSGTLAAGEVFFDGLVPGGYNVTIMPQDGRDPSGPPLTFIVDENGSEAGSAGFTLNGGLKVLLFSDADSNGSQGTIGGLAEARLAGWTVELYDAAITTKFATSTADADGIADLGAHPAGTYLVRVVPPDAGWSTTGVGSAATFLTDNPPLWMAGDPVVPDPVTSCVSGCDYVETELLGGTSHLTTIAMHKQKVAVRAELFNDTNNNGTRDGGETKLVGWPAELRPSGSSTPVATGSVGTDGTITFYVDPGPGAGPHEYDIVLSQPADADLDWRPTPATTSTPVAIDVAYALSVLAGHTVSVDAGFILLGTVGVQVFQDQDANAANDAYESPLAGRTVRLLSPGGTVLDQKATDSTGMAAFAVSAGTDFRLEVLTPLGWVPTLPLVTVPAPPPSTTTTTMPPTTTTTMPPTTTTVGTTVADVTSDPEPLQSVIVEFGQFQITDITLPPIPVADPPGNGASPPFTSAQAVSLTSEAGATIWTTVDGSNPTPATGTLFTGPILLDVDTTLKAVAQDAAGNLSGVMVESYTFDLVPGPPGPQTLTVAPTTWLPEKGIWIEGGVPDAIASDNGTTYLAGYLRIGSVQNGAHQVTWTNLSAFLDPTQVASRLTIGYDATATIPYVTRKILLWDFIASSWVEIDQRFEVTSVSAPIWLAVSTPERFVDITGEVRLRLESKNTNGHEFNIDQLTLTYDDDVAGVTVSPTSVSIDEGGSSATYTAVLDSKPFTNVTIRRSVAGYDVSVTPASRTFTPANWFTPQTFAVTAIDDLIDEDSPHFDTVNHSSAAGDPYYHGIGVSNVSASITDNDTAGVTITEAGGATEPAEGGKKETYTVVLDTEPTANVTITGADIGNQVFVKRLDGGLPVLTFTPWNWATPQTLRIVAVDDDIDELTPHTDTVKNTASSSDPKYNGIGIADITAYITDNDTAGVIISGSPLSVTEGGAGDTYSVSLGSEPTADVTINVLTGSQVSASVPSLTFTPWNWNVPRTLTVDATNDAVAEGTHAGVVTHSATSTDGLYHGIGVDSVSVTVTDNDVAGVTVSSSSVNVTEGGATGTYTVVLDSEPTSNVTITASVAGADAAVLPGSVTFTPLNWSTPRSIVVTAVDDDSAEGLHTDTITHATSSSDPMYDGAASASVSVSVTDNDSPGVSIVESDGSTEVTEEGAVDLYSVVLTTEPATAVTVTSSVTGGEVTTSPPTLTFTPANWNTPQQFTVAAVDDADSEGLHFDQITHTVSSADAAYDAIAVATVTVTIADNEAPVPVTVSGPPVGADGWSATFEAAHLGAEGTETYSWSATVGGVVVATGGGPIFTFTPTVGGLYFVAVVVTDSEGVIAEVTVLYKVLGDIGDSVFVHDIVWLAAEGITKGCNPPANDRFCPQNVLTRGQMAAFLVRALELTDRLDNPYSDDDDSIFEADIEKLAAAGITKGCNPPANDRYCPNNLVTRGQMAAFLRRALAMA